MTYLEEDFYAVFIKTKKLSIPYPTDIINVKKKIKRKNNYIYT